jgi:hypothetical protein
MQPKDKSVMIISQKAPCFNMKEGKNILLLEKQLPADDFEVIVEASATLEGDGNQVAMGLFNDDVNYIWIQLQYFSAIQNPTPDRVYFQKLFNGQWAGSYESLSTGHVYLKIERNGNDYSGYFANVDVKNPANVDQIQWVKLGTLPWIHFQGKLGFCAAKSSAEAADVSAKFYSVLIRKK